MTTFAVYELYPDGREEEVGTISVDQNDSIAMKTLLRKYNLDDSYYNLDSIYRYAIILSMFEQIYGFTKGMNGYILEWSDHKKTSAVINWRIDTWRIRKIDDDELLQSE